MSTEIKRVRPLDGIRVVELATFIAGPCCARYLADLGAEVIKVESPAGDPLHNTAVNEGRPEGELENTTYDLENANKTCISIDTKNPEGKAVLEKLIAGADIFITNIREKSLMKQGLDYETLKARFPALVYGYITGYGEKGPDKDLPGFDYTAFFARGGILGTLYDREHVPMNLIAGFGDHQVGLYLASGIVAALYRAKQTGIGEKVSVSLFHSAIWDMALMLQAAQYDTPPNRFPITRYENSNPLLGAYRTKDDRWLQVAIPAYNALYNKFVKAIGLPELVDDPRYYPQNNLQANLREFYELLDCTFREKTISEWCITLNDADIPYAVAQTWNELLKDPQAWASDCFYSMEYPTGNTRTLVRTPVTMADTPLPEYRRAPYHGEQTESILHDLGYTGEQIQALLKSGAVQDHAGT